MRTPSWMYCPPEPPPQPCEVCGRFDDACICPECQQCGAVGDPKCYSDGHRGTDKHGELVFRLIRSPEQVEGRRKLEQFMKEQAERDNAQARLEIEQEKLNEAYWGDEQNHIEEAEKRNTVQDLLDERI